MQDSHAHPARHFAWEETVRFLLVLAVTIVPVLYYDTTVATEFYHIKATWLNGFVYAACAAFGIGLMARQTDRIFIGPTFAPVLGLTIAAMLSIPGSIRPWRAWEAALLVGAIIPFLLVFTQVVYRREHVRRFLVPVAIVNIGIAAYGFLQYYRVAALPTDRYGTPDPSSTIGLTNFMVEYFFPLIFIWPVLAVQERRRLPKVVFALAALLEWWYFLIADNRAGIVAVAASVLIGLFLMWRRSRAGDFSLPRKKLIFAGVAAAIAVIVLAASPLGGRLAERGASIFSAKKDAAILFRLETWKQSLEIAADHPITGIGVGNTELIFPLYQSQFLEGMTKRQNTRIQHVHNEYLQVLVDMGLIGLLFGAWFLFRLFNRLRALWRRSQCADDWLFSAALILGIAGTFVLAFFAFPFEIPAPALSIMFAIALAEVYAGRILPQADEVVRVAPNFASLAGAAIMLFAVSFGAYSATKMWHATAAHVDYMNGLAAKKLQRPGLAGKYFEQAIERYPEDEAFYFDLAAIALAKGDTMEAIRNFEETSARNPYYPESRKQLGMLSARLGNFEKAVKELTIAYRTQPHQAEEYVPMLVNAYLALGKPGKAVDVASAALARQEEAQRQPNPQLLYERGRARAANGEYEKALSDLEQALKLKPGRVSAKVELGNALVELGRYEEGLEALDETGFSLSSRDKYLRESARARAFLALDKLPEAKGALQTLMRAVPSARKRLQQEADFAMHPEIRPLLFDE